MVNTWCDYYIYGILSTDMERQVWASTSCFSQDDTTSKDPDGNFNEDYCKWCYADGEFKYSSKEQLIDFCVEHMATEEWPAEQVRAHMESVVPGLKHWNISTNAYSS